MKVSSKFAYTSLAAIGVVAVAMIAALLRVTTTELMPDFRQFEAGAERKKEFFGFVRPLIAEANQDVRVQRRRLLSRLLTTRT